MIACEAMVLYQPCRVAARMTEMWGGGLARYDFIHREIRAPSIGGHCRMVLDGRRVSGPGESVRSKAGVRSCGSREAVFARMSCKRLMPAEIIVGINCEHNTGARALRITVPFRPRRPAPTGA